MTVQEAWAVFEKMSVVVHHSDVDSDDELGKDHGDLRGHWVSTGLWRIQAAVRAGFLAVHVDACTDSRRPSGDEDRYATTEHCGDGWYCDKAEEIRRLGQQGG